MTNTQKNNFPHVVRVAFGNCFSTKHMSDEIISSIHLDNSDVWNDFGSSNNVTWFVNGKDVEKQLKEHGAKNTILISEKPLVHDQSVSFWYNKTMLILETFKHFGDDSKILYLDCDVQVIKNPDLKMAQLLHNKIKSGSRILSPIRTCKRPKRVMLKSKPKAYKMICPCNCFMYCEDVKVFEEMLDLYPEVASLYDAGTVTHWTGTKTTKWDDETLSQYWFDKFSCGDCTTQEVVDYFEPPSTVILKKHPPKESDNIKEPSLIYFTHH
jgi:hypothetical protein